MKPIVRSALVALALLLVLAPSTMAAPPAQEGYIVVLHDDVGPPGRVAREIADQVGGDVGFIYEHALRGFSIRLPPQAVAALERNPHVKYVETDYERHAFAQEIPTGIQRIFADTNSSIDIDGSDDYRVDVGVAVIDTGIDFQHPDLNVAGGVNCTSSIFFPSCVAGGDDDHYHGTHVAGTIGALDNGDGVVGVAPGARLYAVKVLNKRGSGYSSWIIAGIDWVAANAYKIEVANMSLGGAGYSQAEYDAIQGAVEKGVAFAVAAGNEDDDANNYSPSAFDNVLTVSALADFDGEPGYLGRPTCRDDQDDTLADFSNWGPEVDIAAPGVCILSTYPLEKGGYGTISGTSMASPHAAGALALLASANNPGDETDVYALYNQVIDAGNYIWTDDSGDTTKEALLDVGNTAVFAPILIATGGTTNTPPNVSISSPANGTEIESGFELNFLGSATDVEDGDLTGSLAWTSSLDGPIGTGGSVSAVLSVGTHTITASATDTGGLEGTANVTVEVSSASNQLSLSVLAYKVRATKYADLTWSGATSTCVDIYRNNSNIATPINTTPFTYRDGPLDKLIKSATYKVCEAGTDKCSDFVTVSW